MIISDKYEVIGEIGRGGMGTVSKVRHVRLQTIHALKVLPGHLAQNPELVQRFEREARVMAQLRHEHIVGVSDIDKHGGSHYFVMDFVPGRNLSQVLKEEGPLAVGDVVRIIHEVGCGLAYAHSRRPPVVHRDIKPANIIIEDGTRRAVVTDFGIAKIAEEQSDMTRTGQFMGTLRYCAPEQILAKADIDGRADIYSLGLVMYEAITGRQFFEGLEGGQIIQRLLQDAGENHADLGADVPTEVARVVDKAIAKDRAARYRSVDQLLADLEALAEGLPGPNPLHLEETGRFTPVGGGGLEEQLDALEREKQRINAELARKRATDFRAAADGAGARDAVAEAFRRADDLLRGAAGRFDASAYEEARELFDRAGAAFAEVEREALDQRRLRDAEEARDWAEQARGRAAEADAGTLAETLFERGERLRAAAERMLAERQTVEAAERFREAEQAYGEAGTGAVHEGRRRRALEAREAMARARLAAEAAKAPERAGEEWSAAERSAAEAATLLEQGDFVSALAAFEEGASGYRAARESAERAESASRVEQARQRALEARGEAEAAGLAAGETVAPSAAKDPTLTDYLSGVRDIELAELAFARGDHTDAISRFQAARAAYRAAAQRVEREKLRALASDARQRADWARAEAERAEAPRWAREPFANARTRFTAAEDAYAQGEYERSASAYREAAELFQATVPVAASGRASAERAALAAQEATEEARSGARSADVHELLPDAWEAAEELVERARAAIATGDPGTARERFEEAGRAYETLLERAAERRVQAAALAELESLEAALADHDEASLDRRGRASFKKAEKLLAGARQRVMAGELERARRDLDAARRALDEIVPVASPDDVTDLGLDAEQAELVRRLAERPARPRERVAPEPERPGAGRRIAVIVAAVGAIAGVVAVAVLFGPTLLERLRGAQPLPASPAEPAVRVAEGATQRFTVTDPRPGFGYRWRRDGELAGEGPTFDVSPPFDAAPRRIALAVEEVAPTDGAASPRAARTWDIEVLDTNRAPSLARVEPESERVAVANDAVTFRVRGADPDGDDLAYRWSLGGRELRADGPDLMLPEDVPNGRQRLVVSARDGKAGGDASLAWDLDVRGRARPAIVAKRPATPSVALTGGEAQVFEVDAEDADPGAALRYAWLLDGETQPSAKARFELGTGPSDRGQRVVVARVTDETGRSDEWRWTVAVEPRGVTTPVEPPPPARPVARMVAPSVASMRRIEGDRVTFRVAAEGASSFRWEIDGTPQASVTGAELGWAAASPRQQPHVVTARAVSPAGLESEPVRWTIQVDPGLPELPPNTAPTISSRSPRGRSVEVAAGERRGFSVEARDAEGATLSYAWSLDGRSVSTEPSYGFRPAANEVGRTRSLEVRVSDGQLATTEAWQVRVVPDPAEVARAERRARIDALLARADQALSADRLVGDGSALAVYREVLAIDRGEDRATQGIARIQRTLVARADRAEADDDLDAAIGALEAALQVQPDTALRGRIADLEERRRERDTPARPPVGGF